MTKKENLIEEIERTQEEGKRNNLILELEDIENQYKGLKGFTQDIESGDYDDIVEKPHKDQ